MMMYKNTLKHCKFCSINATWFIFSPKRVSFNRKMSILLTGQACYGEDDRKKRHPELWASWSDVVDMQMAQYLMASRSKLGQQLHN